MDEWELVSFKLKAESAVFGAGVEVFEAGEVVEDQVNAELGWLTALVFSGPVLCSLLLLTLTSSSCCSSFTSCAESWSCTYITRAPIPRLMVSGERPDRKSLICRTVRRESLQTYSHIYKDHSPA